MNSGPNQAVFIMTDTQRWDMLGCYGNPGMKTPYLDRLASEGVRFERAYTCQPVCGPARSGIFTGTYPHSNGVWANCMPLGANVKTVGQRLSDNGIRTCYIGKWHLDGGDYFGLGRCPEGWDPAYWYDMRMYLEELTPQKRLMSRKPETMEDPGVSEAFTYAHRVTDRALDFLEKHKDEDFFLVVSYDEPHHPFLCPEPFASMYKDYEFPKSDNVYDTLEGKPEHQRAWSGDRLTEDRETLVIKHPYWFGCNSFVDYEIGRVMEAVNRWSPSSMVMYTSDHGDHLESHRLTNKGATMYDENARIPLIVRWPDRAPEGMVHKSAVSHIDITPTLLELYGLPLPKLLEGESLIDCIEHPEKETGRRVFMEFGRYEIDHDIYGGFQPIRAVFDGKYKLVINLLTQDEFYDLEQDPEELYNRIDDPEAVPIRNSLHDALLDWMNTTRDPFRGYYWERRPWRTDARPASWYYTGMTRQREHEEYEPRQLDYNTGLEMEDAVRTKPKKR